MPKQLQLKNKVFGQLTVIDFAYMRNGISWWLCRCSCGNEKVISGNHLLNHMTISCGCKNKINQKNIHKIAKDNFAEGTSLAMIKSQKIPKTNTSGYKGVSWNKQYQRWRAYIIFKGDYIDLGKYEKLDDAIAARQKAENKYYKPILDRRCIMIDNDKNWGGKRIGSGRPQTGRTRRTFNLTDEEYEKVKKYVDEVRKADT